MILIIIIMLIKITNLVKYQNFIEDIKNYKNDFLN